MPISQLPNFLLRSSTGFEHKLLCYNDYGGIALLDNGELKSHSPYVLVKDLHPLPNGRYAWTHVNAFSDRHIAVREFSAQCWLERKEDEYEQ